MTNGNNVLNLDNGGELFNLCLEPDGKLNFKSDNRNCLGNIRLTIDDNSGNVGIGTTSPVAKLQIINQSQDANGNTFILGPTNASNLRLGYHNDYSWIQSHGSKPLAINPLGNNVGIGTINPNEQLVVMNQSVFGGNITSPGSEPITVTGAGAGVSFQDRGGVTDRFVIYNNAGALRFWEGGDRVVIEQNSGNVGIGTTNPNAPLHVRGRLGLENDTIGELWNLFVDNSGNLTFNSNSVTAGTNRLFINDDNGNVGIGTTNPTEKLHVVGNICATGSIGACSDLRYKTDIEPLADSLNKVLSMHGMRYQWNQEAFPNHGFDEEPQVGFIGQEVENICPEVVSTDSEGYKYLDYSRLTPVLVEAIKEQQEIIEQQKSALGEALGKLAQLEVTVQKISADS